MVTMVIPTPPMLPLMPRGMDADAAMPMPGSGGSSVEREPGAAVCAPAPNFELLCVVWCTVWHQCEL